jgi:hypothetical protein
MENKKKFLFVERDILIVTEIRISCSGYTLVLIDLYNLRDYCIIVIIENTKGKRE